MTRSTNTALGTEQPSLLVSERPLSRRHFTNHVKPLTRDPSTIRVRRSCILGILINLSLVITVQSRWQEDGAQGKNLHSTRAPRTIAALFKRSLLLIQRIRIRQYLLPILLSQHHKTHRSTLPPLGSLRLRMASHTARKHAAKPSQDRNSGCMAARLEGMSTCLGRLSHRS